MTLDVYKASLTKSFLACRGTVNIVVGLYSNIVNGISYGNIYSFAYTFEPDTETVHVHPKAS